jgi:hypothetical protein
MKRLLIPAIIVGLAVAGCDVTETHRDYRPGYYDQGYAYNQVPPPQPYPPGYAQPGYPPPQYVPAPQYPPGDYRRDYRPDDRRPPEPNYQPAQHAGPYSLQERIALGDNLVGSIDDYQRSITDDRRPEVSGMKNVMSSMRVVADNWRKGVRSGMSLPELRASAADIRRRFDQANQQYANLVQMNKRYESDRFSRVAQAVYALEGSVQQ